MQLIFHLFPYEATSHTISGAQRGTSLIAAQGHRETGHTLQSIYIYIYIYNIYIHNHEPHRIVYKHSYIILYSKQVHKSYEITFFKDPSEEHLNFWIGFHFSSGLI